MHQILYLALILAASAHAIVTPDCIRLLGERLVGVDLKVADLLKREKEIVRTMQKDPAKLFTELRRQAQANGKDGDFAFPVFEPTMRLILDDVGSRLGEELLPEDRALFTTLIEQGRQLLHSGLPYKESMRFTFRYTQALDHVFLRLHPELRGQFHKNHAEHVLEKMLARAPDVLMLPSFQSVGFRFFNASRAAPLHLIGLHPSGLRKGEPVPFADGYDMMPSEFAWHDMGHIEFMAGRDFEYTDGTFKPLERVVQEWDFTRKRFEAFQNTNKGDKNLYDAMTLLMFEILHERGYQYSLSVLKAQLDTPKWTEILKRKLENGYFKRFTWVNMNLFPELEKARAGLLKWVAETRSADQKQHLAALFANDLAVRVTHFPKVNYGTGALQGIDITDGDVKVRTKTANGTIQTPLAENLVLAQVSPTKSTPFNEEAMKHINAVLNAKKTGQPLTVNGATAKVDKVVVAPDKSIAVVFSDGRMLPLGQVNVPRSLYSAPALMLDRHFFELNQVLGGYEKQQPLSYTLHDPTKVYLGTAASFQVGGKDMLRVTTNAGTFEMPLTEALVDPLQKVDFTNMGQR